MVGLTDHRLPRPKKPPRTNKLPRRRGSAPSLFGKSNSATSKVVYIAGRDSLKQANRKINRNNILDKKMAKFENRTVNVDHYHNSDISGERYRLQDRRKFNNDQYKKQMEIIDRINGVKKKKKKKYIFDMNKLRPDQRLSKSQGDNSSPAGGYIIVPGCFSPEHINDSTLTIPEHLDIADFSIHNEEMGDNKVYNLDDNFDPEKTFRNFDEGLKRMQEKTRKKNELIRAKETEKKFDTKKIEELKKKKDIDAKHVKDDTVKKRKKRKKRKKKDTDEEDDRHSSSMSLDIDDNIALNKYQEEQGKL